MTPQLVYQNKIVKRTHGCADGLKRVVGLVDMLGTTEGSVDGECVGSVLAVGCIEGSKVGAAETDGDPEG